jgi:hypothetical protein
MQTSNHAVFIEEVENKQLSERLSRFRRNGEWLTEHGAPLFAQYAGRYLAVSEGEVFVADDMHSARQLAQEKHPEDEPFVQYIPLEQQVTLLASPHSFQINLAN